MLSVYVYRSFKTIRFLIHIEGKADDVASKFEISESVKSRSDQIREEVRNAVGRHSRTWTEVCVYVCVCVYEGQRVGGRGECVMLAWKWKRRMLSAKDVFV